MITLSVLLLLAAELGRDADGCPDINTSYGRLLIEAGESCARIDNERKQQAALEAKRESIVRRYSPRSIAPNLKAAIVRRMNILAIDGPSIRYLWPIQKHPYVYCGFINGKNRLGGYTGWTTFIAELSDNGTLESLDTDDDDSCAYFGYETYPD